MAITRRSAVAKDQPQATPPPLPPLPPPPSAADITPNSNNINHEQPQQQQKQPQQKQQSAVVSAETVSNYEQTREQRMKENRERLQKLGIVDLALQLKSITATKRTPRRTQFDRKTPQKSPSLDTSERRRSSRLQNAPAVTYTELKEEKPKRGRDIVLEEGAKPEVYNEEHEKLLGNTEMPWTFFIDGYRADGTRIYDPISGKTCHQCRQKTLGQRTRCCKCNLVQGQFCGDCLMMRYGEHVVEANQNPDWICPPCRGICNCSLCRQAKGWYPTGALYKRISKLGYKSVAHYLITTKRAPPDAENSSDAPQLVKRSLPFEGMELPNDTGSDDKVAAENTDPNPHSENKAATFVEPDPKSEGVGRSWKRSKKENTDAGKESVTANEDSADSPVPNMNSPNSLTPSVRRSGRRSIQGNVDIGEMAVKTNEIPGEEPVSAIKDPNSSESKVDSIARRLRSRNKT